MNIHNQSNIYSVTDFREEKRKILDRKEDKKKYNQDYAQYVINSKQNKEKMEEQNKSYKRKSLDNNDMLQMEMKQRSKEYRRPSLLDLFKIESEPKTRLPTIVEEEKNTEFFKVHADYSVKYK